MPVQLSDNLAIASHSVEDTVTLGILLGYSLTGGDVIGLSGDLGAGKTAFTFGIGKGWGALELINSPTFVFVHEHRRAVDDMRLYHVDCYRLTNLDDAETIGLEDILAGDGVTVIEWPERIAALLPPERLWITLEAPDNLTEDRATERTLTFQATGARYVGLLDDLRRDVLKR